MAEDFKALVDAAEPGATIVLQEGTYVISGIMRIDKVRVIGQWAHELTGHADNPHFQLRTHDASTHPRTQSQRTRTRICC